MGVVQQKSGSINDGVTFDAPVSAGNSIVVLLAYRGDVALTVSDTVNGATYEQSLGHYFHAGGNGTVQVSYIRSSASGTPTVTQTGTSSGGTMSLIELSGMDTGAGFVSAAVEGAVADTSAPFEPGLSISPTDAATFLVVVASDIDNDARVCTGAAGDITNGVATGVAGCNYGYATLASGGTKTAALAFDAGDTWAMQAYSFKLSGAAPAALSGSAAATATAAGTLTPNQSAAPIATISAGAWVPSTGASLPPMLSEAVPDHGTFIWVPIANSACELLFTSLPDPGVSGGHAVSFWASSPVSATLRFRIMQGATQVAQWDQAVTPTLTPYSLVLSSAEADAITDYTDLRVRIEAL